MEDAIDRFVHRLGLHRSNQENLRQQQEQRRLEDEQWARQIMGSTVMPVLDRAKEKLQNVGVSVYIKQFTDRDVRTRIVVGDSDETRHYMDIFFERRELIAARAAMPGYEIPEQMEEVGRTGLEAPSQAWVTSQVVAFLEVALLQ